jgi:hypothetical protein
MDLLPEILDLMIQFLSIDDLVEFRLVGKDSCAHAKGYEGDKTQMVYPNTLTGLFQSFPLIHSLDTTNCDVKVTDFQKFGRLEELKVSIKPLETEDILRSCLRLKKLELISDRFIPRIDLNQVFQGLTCLKILHLVHLIQVTDHALLYLPLLEELCLWENSGITGTGLKTLPRLKRLKIETPINSEGSMIRDDELVGLNIIQLHMINNENITDQGICHLTQLKRLFCVKCPLIQGNGFTELSKLQTVGIGESFIEDISRFSNSKNLSFRECQIQGNLKCSWKNLEKLRVHESTFRYPQSIVLMTAPKLKQLRYENCWQLKEEALRKTFGNRLQVL